MRIAVVEDEPASAEELTAALNQWSAETGEQISVTAYADGESFLERYDGSFDTVFLDILLPGIDGLKTAEELRQRDQDVILIFLTNVAQYALDGYRYSAQDYFVKPFSYYALKLRMDRIRSFLEVRRDAAVPLAIHNGIKILSTRDIYFIESAAHEMTYHTREGNFESRGKSIRALEEELRPYGFRRCNVCYLVNLHHCTGVQGTTLFVAGEELTISRNKRKEFLQEISKYLTGGNR